MGSGQGRNDVTKRNFPDHEQIHVARGSERPARAGPVNQSHTDPVRQRSQGPAKLVRQSGGLQDNALDLLENRRCRVRLIEDMVASGGPPKDSRRGQLLELLRDGAGGRTADPDQLAHVERLVRMGEKPAQQLPPGFPEEHRSRVGDRSRTHISYDCTRITYSESEELRADRRA